ncbi:biotin/lipoyl-binding protein, partial [bacterium]|nr:biotin/lipoyl-binding protein [bacterium]
MNILNNPQTTTKNTASLEERVKSLKISNVVEMQGTKKSTIFAWGLCFIMMFVAGLMTWRSYKITPAALDSTPQKTVSQVNNSTGSDSVKTVRENTQPGAVKGKENIVLEAKGYVVPVHQIQVSPKVPGMIEKLYVEEGKRVKKGDVLAVLESIDYKADFEKAKAVLQVATQRKLEIKNGRCIGLHLDTGEFIGADAVVFNGDASALASGFLGSEAVRGGMAMSRSQRALSAIT